MHVQEYIDLEINNFRNNLIRVGCCHSVQVFIVMITLANRVWMVADTYDFECCQSSNGGGFCGCQHLGNESQQ